jgi:hypothetical protein
MILTVLVNTYIDSIMMWCDDDDAMMRKKAGKEKDIYFWHAKLSMCVHLTLTWCGDRHSLTDIFHTKSPFNYSSLQQLTLKSTTNLSSYIFTVHLSTVWHKVHYDCFIVYLWTSFLVLKLKHTHNIHMM